MILACYIIYYTAHFKPEAICVKCMLKSIILHNSVGVKLHDSTKQSQKIVSYDISSYAKLMARRGVLV